MRRTISGLRVAPSSATSKPWLLKRRCWSALQWWRKQLRVAPLLRMVGAVVEAVNRARRDASAWGCYPIILLSRTGTVSSVGLGGMVAAQRSADKPSENFGKIQTVFAYEFMKGRSGLDD